MRLQRASDGAIALLRRSNTGFLDGYYAFPGGHLQHGEQVAQAAARELLEETGVRACDLTPLLLLPYLMGSKAGREAAQGINIVFACTQWEGEVVNNEPHLADDLAWCQPDALPERVPLWLVTAAQCPVDPQADPAWYHEMTFPSP